MNIFKRLITKVEQLETAKQEQHQSMWETLWEDYCRAEMADNRIPSSFEEFMAEIATVDTLQAEMEREYRLRINYNSPKFE